MDKGVVCTLVKWSGLAADNSLYYGVHLHLHSPACLHEVHRDKLTFQQTFRAAWPSFRRVRKIGKSDH